MAPLTIIDDVLTSTPLQPALSVAGLPPVQLRSLQGFAARGLRNLTSTANLASTLAGAIAILRGPQPDIDQLVDYEGDD